MQTRTPWQPEPVYVHMSPPNRNDREKALYAPQAAGRIPPREPSNPVNMTSQQKADLLRTRPTRRDTTPPSTRAQDQAEGTSKIQTDQAVYKEEEGPRRRRTMQEFGLDNTLTLIGAVNQKTQRENHLSKVTQRVKTWTIQTPYMQWS